MKYPMDNTYEGRVTMLLNPKREEIKKRREEVNLSMNALSVKAGLSPQSIYRIESGTTEKVNSYRAELIAKTLGCKVNDIFEKRLKG